MTNSYVENQMNYNKKICQRYDSYTYYGALENRTTLSIFVSNKLFNKESHINVEEDTFLEIGKVLDALLSCDYLGESSCSL